MVLFICPIMVCLIYCCYLSCKKQSLDKVKQTDESARNLMDDLEAPSQAVVDPEQISFDDTPLEETDNEVEMEKRRQADLQKFCTKVFNKLIFDATIAKIEHKEQREEVVGEMVKFVLKEMNHVIDDNERIKQEKLRWVMN